MNGVSSPVEEEETGETKPGLGRRDCQRETPEKALFALTENK